MIFIHSWTEGKISFTSTNGKQKALSCQQFTINTYSNLLSCVVITILQLTDWYCVSQKFKQKHKVHKHFLCARIFVSSIHCAYNTQHFFNWQQLMFYASFSLSSHTAHTFSSKGLYYSTKLYTHKQSEVNTKCI